MTDARSVERRAVEDEEPLEAQQIFTGPKWLRRILLKGSQDGE